LRFCYTTLRSPSPPGRGRGEGQRITLGWDAWSSGSASWTELP
jgi:hypothetical protein